MREKIELHAHKKQYTGGYLITAYVGDRFAGEATFYGYTKREALKVARETVKSRGGIGIYAEYIKRGA
jgi:hypothetical protein